MPPPNSCSANTSRCFLPRRFRSRRALASTSRCSSFRRETSFAALVQTANSLEAAAVVSGLSSKMSAHEQAYRVGQAWEALPEPKKQITFYVVSPNGEAESFHIGPHAPSLQADDVELVHRLWLNFPPRPGDAEPAPQRHRDPRVDPAGGGICPRQAGNSVGTSPPGA